MKKKAAAVLAVSLMVTNVLPVFASEVDEKELTNVTPAGATAVEADILSGDSGEVSYVISIPEKIDFGTLQMPKDMLDEHVKTVGFEVSAVEINGLDTSTSRVAVLMKDSVDSKNFRLQGVSGTNNGKILSYSVLNSAGVDITSGTEYANGYAIAAFSAAGQSIGGTLSLEQNQLLSDPEVANWAGDYLGTINFYTAIAQIGSFN